MNFKARSFQNATRGAEASKRISDGRQLFKLGKGGARFRLSPKAVDILVDIALRTGKEPGRVLMDSINIYNMVTTPDHRENRDIHEVNHGVEA